MIGLTLIAQVFNGARLAYFLLATVLAIVLVLFVLIIQDTVLPKEIMPPFRLKQFLAGFLQPLTVRDFSLTLIGRTFVIFGYYTVVGYLLYYLQDVVHYPQATQGVAFFQILSTGVLIIATITSGVVSDRLQRRKPFVIAASCIMALALIILAFFPLWPLVLAAAAILGLGFGIFLSGDLALQTQVLPERQDNGKDLGILNTANLLPQILVPIVVGIVLAIFHSYSALFFIGAVATCLGACVIFPVKSVR